MTALSLLLVGGVNLVFHTELEAGMIINGLMVEEERRGARWVVWCGVVWCGVVFLLSHLSYCFVSSFLFLLLSLSIFCPISFSPSPPLPSPPLLSPPLPSPPLPSPPLQPRPPLHGTDRVLARLAPRPSGGDDRAAALPLAIPAEHGLRSRLRLLPRPLPLLHRQHGVGRAGAGRVVPLPLAEGGPRLGGVARGGGRIATRFPATHTITTSPSSPARVSRRRRRRVCAVQAGGDGI